MKHPRGPSDSGCRTCHRNSRFRFQLRSRSWFRDAEDREQPGRGAVQQPGRQQGQRIQILRATQQAPVQTAPVTVERPRLDRGHHLAGADPRAHGKQRADRFVRRTQRRVTRTGESDGEHPAAGDPPREQDPAGGHGPHRGAGRRGQIHSAVTGPVRRGRRLPAPYDHRTRRTQRPIAITAGGRGRARGGPEHRGPEHG